MCADYSAPCVIVRMMFSALSIEEAFAELSSRNGGLTGEEVEQKRAQSGWNRLPHKKKSVVMVFLRQFHDVLIYILIGALALSVVLRVLEGGSSSLEHNVDIAAIFLILILNAVLGFVQEFRAEKAMEGLQSLTSPQARVRRDGQEFMIPSEELVPGDVVLLETGDRVSADGRLIEESHLDVNESSLTGESVPVAKNVEKLEGVQPLGDQRNMVFAGTLVTNGSGSYVVTAIGLHTEIGHIASMVSQAETPPTPLEQRMKRLSAGIGIFVLILCAILAGFQLSRGVETIAVVLLGVSLAVSAVPEGLPAVVTASLAMGVRRMVGMNALVRRLDSLETLGSVTVICSDKTGTITENRMKVVEAWVPLRGRSKDQQEEDELLMIQIAASCNRARLPDLGDPTEVGLLRYAEERGVDRLPFDEEEVPFTSEEKYMRTRHGERSFLKGAPEKILALTNDPDAEEIEEAHQSMAKEGLRVLAMAVMEGGNIRFIGLMGMEDPPRAEVTAALAEAHTAGIRTIMITGDNLQTAQAIAKHVGIGHEAVDGATLDTWSPAKLRTMVRTVSVYARVSPVHKLKILQALQQDGEIVAMTGDGVNDAPALKTAHVGVAMGRDGTQVAREAASLILTDDNYATIVSAVREGRRIYDNIRKFVFYLVQANFGQLMLITLCVLLGLPLPLLPLHILWINLMTDGLPALALGMEREEPGLMKRPPRPPSENLFTGEWAYLFYIAAFACGSTFIVFLWALLRFEEIESVRAITFTYSIFLELMLSFVSRSRVPITRIGLFTNTCLVWACAIPLALQIGILLTPVRSIFEIGMLSVELWLLLGLVAGIGFAILELSKLLMNRR